MRWAFQKKELLTRVLVTWFITNHENVTFDTNTEVIVFIVSCFLLCFLLQSEIYFLFFLNPRNENRDWLSVWLGFVAKMKTNSANDEKVKMSKFSDKKVSMSICAQTRGGSSAACCKCFISLEGVTPIAWKFLINYGKGWNSPEKTIRQTYVFISKFSREY